MSEHDGELFCFEIAMEIRSIGDHHCATCHGDNFSGRGNTKTVQLSDGRMAKVCCAIARSLVMLGMISADQLLQFEEVGLRSVSPTEFDEISRFSRKNSVPIKNGFPLPLP